VAQKRRFTILFSCIGRRVALVNAFRRSLEALGLEGRVLGADQSPLSAALQLCDKRFIVRSLRDPEYVSQLVDICRAEHVDLAVPLIDPELRALAGSHERFREVGTTLCLSSPDVLAVCGDKVAMHARLTAAGIDMPRLFEPREVRDEDFPLFMKPRRGSSAKDIHKLASREEMDFYLRRVPDAIVQEFIAGQEFTLDIFADFSGRPRIAVPRKRIEVRGGEVTKGMTVKDPDLIRVGMNVVSALGGCMGTVTLQCFRTPSGRIPVIEVNPRLGGGAPLSIRAGADLPGWTIRCALGQNPEIDPLGFQDRLVMLRWDEAVFVAEGDLPQ
jgi:carbamoyl-phosphate synthase large subunit